MRDFVHGINGVVQSRFSGFSGFIYLSIIETSIFLYL